MGTALVFVAVQHFPFLAEQIAVRAVRTNTWRRRGHVPSAPNALLLAKSAKGAVALSKAHAELVIMKPGST